MLVLKLVAVHLVVHQHFSLRNGTFQAAIHELATATLGMPYQACNRAGGHRG